MGRLTPQLENGASRAPIPVIETGADFPMATLIAAEARCHALLDAATRFIPGPALRVADAISRRWLAKWNNPHLPEIDAIASRLQRPGPYFLSVNYEWGCTCSVRPCPDSRSARLVRVLDWRTKGLGRNIVAANVRGPAGPFTTLTWPGYTGVLQAMAPGRFSAALNQAPMPKAGGGRLPLDWMMNRVRVWRTPHPTPAQVLRLAFETATSFAEAKRLLTEHPIASPAIFSLAGLDACETCVIERTEEAASIHDGPAVAANHWQTAHWRGRPRGQDSVGRFRLMRQATCDLDPAFDWLKPPVLNKDTRLVMVADAARGRLVAQGFETDGPATEPLDLTVAAHPAGKV